MDGGGENSKTCSTKMLALFTILLLIIVALVVVVVILATNMTPMSTMMQQECPSPTTPTASAPPPVGSKSPLGVYRHAAVAADAATCSPVGTYIMTQKGGSAVDAAIATMLCNGVVNMHSAGIGGGFLMTIYDKKGDSVKTLIARETAPANASQDMYVDGAADSLIGGMSIGIPGEVMGYWEAWKAYGAVPWKDLFLPTIKLAREGFKVNAALHTAVHHPKVQDVLKRKDNTLREILLKPDGNYVEEGDTLKLPKLADTLEKIANEGAHTYYNGSLAQDIADDIRDLGGIITLDDLKTYSVKWKDPVEVHIQNGNYTMYGPPPPSSSVILGFILKILDGFKWTKDDMRTDEQKILNYHRIVEAMKFSFGKRTALGDMDFVPGLNQLMENLTSYDFADATREKINDSHTQPVDYYEPLYDQANDTGTSHLSVLGQDGSAVAITSTINWLLGCRYVGNRTGILFNDEMDDFSTPGLINAYGYRPSPANFIEPGKRPLSSMSPTITLDGSGNVVLINGASGAGRIITSSAFTAINNLWFGFDISKAVDLPRIHHQLMPDHIRHGPGLSKVMMDGLKAKGHELQENPSMGVVQAISSNCSKVCPDMEAICTQPCVFAVCDYRKAGVPDGF